MNQHQRTIAALLATALLFGAYFAMSPIVLSRFFLYMPKTVGRYSDIPQKVFGAQGEAVVFLSPTGKRLHGFYFKKAASKFTVLLHHGQGGNLGTHFGLAKTMLLAGYSVFTYDYEGFGASQGSPSNENMLKDGEAAFSYLVDKREISPLSIIQCGVSLGTGIASHTAETKPCAAVILISPYTSINQVAMERLPLLKLYPKSLFPEPDIGSLHFIKSNIKTPVLFIHGKNDQIISAHHAQDLNNLAKCPHLLILAPQAHHGDFSTLFLAEQIKHFAEQSRLK